MPRGFLGYELESFAPKNFLTNFQKGIEILKIIGYNRTTNGEMRFPFVKNCLQDVLNSFFDVRKNRVLSWFFLIFYRENITIITLL